MLFVKVESEVLLNLDIAMKKKIVLYQSLLKRSINIGAQLVKGRVSPLLFLKIVKKYLNFGKNCPVCEHVWVKLSTEMQFWRKNTKISPCGALLLYVAHEVFIEVSLFQEICPPPRNSSLRACNLQLNFSY